MFPTGHTHRGPVVGAGFACPTEKQNRGLVILRGWRNVRECDACGENFSHAADLIEPGVSPAPEVVREFARSEGVAVVVES